MLELKALDSRSLKARSWWSHHVLFVTLIGAVLTIASAYLGLLPGVFLLGTLIIASYLYLFSDTFLPGNVVAKQNKFGKFFLNHSTDWNFMEDQYRSMKKSSFIKNENFVWGLEVSGTEVALMFTSDGGCVSWMKLGRKFPHLVVDSLEDNHRFHKQLPAKTLPPEKIKLEGDFPDYFKVYQDPGKQNITLQILSPDRILFLVERLKDINLEIEDDFLRLYAANAQKSSEEFRALLKTLQSFQSGLKTSRISAIK